MRQRWRSGAPRAGALLVVAAAAVAVAACSSTAVGGQGSAAPTTGSAAASSHDFPSTSAAPTTASAPASAPASTTPAVPTAAQRDAALAARAGGARVLVRVPGGYEALTYDQAGHLGFWADPLAGTAWRQIGSSRYPLVRQLGPPHAEAVGALLRGMAHATFIVRGVFTGDSSGNAVAYTTGSRGWGAIKAERSGRIGPSGRPVDADQIGLSFDFGFSAGYLRTEDCPANRPIADCGSHPVVKRWRWAGSDFVLA